MVIHNADLCNDLSIRILERLAQHTDNLELWQSGYLNPTEPDPQERECVIRELKACIAELAPLAEMLGFPQPPSG